CGYQRGKKSQGGGCGGEPWVFGDGSACSAEAAGDGHARGNFPRALTVPLFGISHSPGVADFAPCRTFVVTEAAGRSRPSLFLVRSNCFLSREGLDLRSAMLAAGIQRELPQ